MPNMSLKKNEMPSQEPNVRNNNFLEVALGYTEEETRALLAGWDMKEETDHE